MTGSFDAMTYLHALERKGIHLGLGPVRRALGSLGNPHRAFPSVLVGGTNGKGSAAAMIASILTKAGLRTGLYTSPHLVDVTERIRIDGRMIGKDEFRRLVREISRSAEGRVTYFEFLTVLAFLYFARARADIAVLEVGMGGRLDATNVVRPEVSIITNVALDHREFLGSDLASIAREKGGIIHRGGVCVTAARNSRVIGVLQDICHRRKATLLRVGRELRCRRVKEGVLSYAGPLKTYGNLALPLAGGHQVANAACALGAVEHLIAKGFAIDDDAVARGMAEVEWEGRLETVSTRPRIVLDGAHNAAATAALCRALEHSFSYRRLIVVFSVLADKDCRRMVKALARRADRIIVTGLEEARALPPGRIAEIAGEYHPRVERIDDPSSALARAVAVAGRDDLICVTGSLYLVGAVKRHSLLP